MPLSPVHEPLPTSLGSFLAERSLGSSGSRPMNTAAAALTAPARDFLAAFAEHNCWAPVWASAPAARAFLEVHPNLGAWMAIPVDFRLVELRAARWRNGSGGSVRA
jgi:hypothetical protein